ncbi:MAG: ATP-grasp domain-containing protein [Hormoscilla sp. SP5CHS1]|nr:ATP-grasp domain-containing protein [Hormoscilla sp. SP12CHS1]MBC6453918.1 ATP-grasp domain-containing protein [Hormoscilla sp. SP5CHS1]
MFLQAKIWAFFQNIGTLTLLLLALPFNAIVVLPCLLWSWIAKLFQKKVVAANPKNILITGGKMTKALQLARCFYAAGHTVFLVETHKYWLSGHRFSRVVKGFFTVPAPEKDANGYCQGLLDIVKQEKIDVFIPVSSPVASYYDSIAKSLLSPHCEALTFDAEITEMLDNKFTFCQKARELGLTAPKAFLITDPEQVLNFDFTADGSQYIIKSIAYNSVYRLDMTKLPMSSKEQMASFVKGLPISESQPWIMQEFISGQEYCTHSTVRNGIVRLHCCSQSSPFQVNYEQVDNQEIFQWVQQFVKALNLTGQISLDVIQTKDGKVYPVECNPRTHTAITMFYNHPGVADAYILDSKEDCSARTLRDREPPIQPLPESKPTYWTYHELWRLTGIRSWGQLKGWFNKIIKGTDGIFQVNDPLPFLMVHHWQIPLLLLNNMRKFKGWVKIDFNIGKLVELGGD